MTEHDKEVESMEKGERFGYLNAKKIMLKQPNVCS